MSEQWLFFPRFLPFSCIVLCSIITHPVSMMKLNQQMYIHQVEDGVLLHFYFFLVLHFPSLQNPLVELCYTRSLSLHWASDKHSRTFIGSKKQQQLSDLESTL